MINRRHHCRACGGLDGDGDDRTLVDLLVDQIEFADVVVLNKCSDAGPDKLTAARLIVTSLNPDAQIVETDYGQVPHDRIFDTRLFDFERAHTHPLWAKELYGFADHIPETEEYGVSSFVYRARRPFDPQKIHDVLNGPLPGVIRAKAVRSGASPISWAIAVSGQAVTVGSSPGARPGAATSAGRAGSLRVM